MVQHHRLVNGAGVVVQAPGDGQVHGEVVLGHPEGGQVLHHLAQLLQALVEGLVAAPVTLQGGQDSGVVPGDGDEGENLIRRRLADPLLDEQGADLVGADLVQLVHGAHDVPGLALQALHGIEAGENLPVVHPDLKALQAQGGEGLVDDGGDLRLVGDVQLAVADDVDVALVELPEPAPLGPLPPVDLADLVPAEGEGELAVVQGHVLGQGDGEVKAQGQVAVPLGEAVNLFLGLAAPLGQQNLRRLDDGGVQGGEAVEAVGLAQGGQHPFKLALLPGQQLHKAGQGPGLDSLHSDVSFLLVQADTAWTESRFPPEGARGEPPCPVPAGRAR